MLNVSGVIGAVMNLNYFFKKKVKSNVFWWEPKDGSVNAGDHLSKVIVELVLSLKDKEIINKKSSKNKLLSIGSVMHFARDGDCIWGTGINGKINPSKINFSDLDVRAVRGPCTRDFLLAKGIFVPEIYGDPGILLPLFYNKNLFINEAKTKEFIVIPHMNENFDVYNEYSAHICSPKQGAVSFLREIVNSKFVISSSLHGLIIAESYGIPAVFLEGNSGESLFKYDDYYLGTGRSTYARAKSVPEALSYANEPIVELYERQMELLSSFPYDLW